MAKSPPIAVTIYFNVRTLDQFKGIVSEFKKANPKIKTMWNAETVYTGPVRRRRRYRV